MTMETKRDSLQRPKGRGFSHASIMMNNQKELKIKLFADGANIKEMEEAHAARTVSGFTTNPTLMKKAGVTNYSEFAKSLLRTIKDMPISFEVFSDGFAEMEREAKTIASWGKNVYVKIPITNTKSEPSYNLIKKLSAEGVKVNVTAILTTKQVKAVAKVLSVEVPSIISVFAGRISDTGRNPIPIMKRSLKLLKSNPKTELLWASTREALNITQADNLGVHIITVTPDILKKLPMRGKSLAELSLDTVKMFYNDAQVAGFKI